MNSGYNAPMYHMSAMAMESMCQQSMYQQHTYVDRTRMAVTDVFVQEHVSQSSWTMSTPPVPVRAPVYVQPGRAPSTPNNRFAYMPMPNMQYYASSSASMNSYGQSFMQHSTASSNMSGMYTPQNYPTNVRPKPYFRDTSCQTQAATHAKRSFDVSTQTDVIGDAPPLIILKHQANPSEGNKEPIVLESFAAANIFQGERRNSEVTLPMQRLHDITRISLQGSDIAERLANAHRQRPCFKKMDTLCARLKQDLLRPDGVLPNINSQGIAWAVKDFIFVFTRIVNSWVILKGYVYNTPDALNKIKDELPFGFMSAFDCWQKSTLTLVEMIIQSFVNLDAMLQKQKNSFSNNNINVSNNNSQYNNNNNYNNSSNNNNNNTTNNNNSSNGNSSDSNSSNKTLNGTDILAPETTAFVSAQDNMHEPSAHSTPQNIKNTASNAAMRNFPNESKDQLNQQPPCCLNLNYLYTMIQDSEEAQRCVNANGTYLKTGTYTPLKKDGSPMEQSPPKQTNIVFRNVQPPQQAQQVLPQPTLEQPKTMRQVPKMINRQCDVKSYQLPLRTMGREMVRRLYELSSRILQMKNIDRFFQKQFTRNYYPYFFERCHQEFVDVRAIILKCESANYQHIFQAVHDMRRIIYLVRRDLKDHTNMDLRLYTALYERAVNEMLSKPPYHIDNFEHINGSPGEQLFNFNM